MDKKNVLKLTGSILLCQSAGIVGSLATGEKALTWYNSLNRSEFSPPNWLFAPVWIGNNNQYPRIAARRDAKRAAVAVGHSALVMSHHILTRRDSYIIHRHFHNSCTAFALRTHRFSVPNVCRGPRLLNF